MTVPANLSSSEIQCLNLQMTIYETVALQQIPNSESTVPITNSNQSKPFL